MSREELICLMWKPVRCCLNCCPTAHSRQIDVVDISGNVAIVSQRLEETRPTDPMAINTGFLFDVTTGAQTAQFSGTGMAKGTESFEAMAISGGRAVVGQEGIGRARAAVQPIPEPECWSLLASFAASVALLSRRRQ
jgi:hypothetical protein